MKRELIFISMTLALVCACSQKKQEAANAAVQADPKVAVDTARMQEVLLDDTYSTSVEAYAVNNIAPQSAGRIKSIQTEIGSFVSKGQLLATMDDLQLQQANIKLANDQIEYDRLKALLDEGGVSQSDFDQIEMTLKLDKTNVENLRQNTYLESPLNGVVTARNYDVGDMYSMSQPIFTVQQITPVKLLVGITESSYTKVKIGQKVTITVDAFPGETFSGSIVRLYPVMNQASHTFNVEVHVTNGDHRLRPGMYAKVNVVLGLNNSVVIPDSAIVKQQGSGVRTVFVLDGNVAKSKIVTLGRHIGDKYEVLTGLYDGEVVVVKGARSLKNNQKVEVI